MTENSPSHCTYCYSIACAVRVQSLSSAVKTQAVQTKSARVTVGRNSGRRIAVQVELTAPRNGQPAVASYLLADCVVHQQAVAQGKGTIEIPSRKLAIQMSNCPPRKLNVFLKSLQAKLDLMRSENPETIKTPVHVARAMLMQGLPAIFNPLSPLSIAEIRQVRRLRGVATGESPMTTENKENKTPSRRGSDACTDRKSSDVATPKAGKKPLTNQTPRTLKRSMSLGQLSSNQTTTTNGFVPLSVEQKSVVRAVVHDKQNIFFTGSAGTGKSLVLRRIIELLPASSTIVTAATGVAACQIGGVTLHSFAGFGAGNCGPEQALKIVEGRKELARQWKRASHLIIDEISMIDANYFTNLEYVACGIRNNDRPFGGIQLVITGDFLQLPPVTKGQKKPQFAFQSEAWCRSVHKTILLRDIRRQDDQKFVRILQEIRVGQCSEQSLSILHGTKSNDLTGRGLVPTRLCSHTADADAVNKHNLQNLQEAEKVFTAQDEGFISDAVQTFVAKEIRLKINAQVMLTKNLDLARGLSNGSRGVVTGFNNKSGYPIVQFLATPTQIEVRTTTFQFSSGDRTTTRRQLPLQLAWAISIHKSQGLTLDSVEMSLNRVFAEGQVYVALSRARSLASIRVLSIDSSVIKANTEVVRYYNSILQNQNEDEDDGFVIRKRSRLSL